MSVYLEDALPVVKYNGLNTTKDVSISGALTVSGTTTFAAATFTDLTATGNTTLGDALTDTVTVAAPLYVRAKSILKQSAPTAKTTSATLTAAELVPGLITVNQGAGASSALQLPTASAMDTLFTGMATDDSFDVGVINTSTVDAEDASITTNTGWTLVGNMDFQAHSALAAQGSSGLLRLRKTGTGAWTCYRIS